MQSDRTPTLFVSWSNIHNILAMADEPITLEFLTPTSNSVCSTR